MAVVGATGVVGTTMLELLRQRSFPASEIVPFATERSAGRELDGGLVVRALNDEADLSGFDLALFSAGGGTSREWAPRFVEAGAIVVDNSSAWRRDPEIPLVVSEVNPHALERHRGLIANPNCSTMQMMVALAPIHRRAGIERLVVATYQSVSGTGKKAIDELDAQARASLNGGEMPAPRGVSRADRVQRDRGGGQLRRRRRPHRRGAQDDVRDAQDPRGRVDRDRRHLRARARCGSPTPRRSTCRPASRSRPRRCGSCSPRLPEWWSRTCLRRCGRPSGTRCSSVASAATSRTPARSACGSSATTCARAPPPTRSRSPRSSSSADCSRRRASVAA